MHRFRVSLSVFVVGACTLAITALPGSGAAQSATRGSFVAAPRVTEPPSKPFQRSSGVEKASVRPARTELVAGGYMFVPINPFRTLDSRAYSDGFMGPGDTWFFDVVTDQAGSPMIPSSAVAVTYNLTIAGTRGGGYCALYPADIYWPGNSSINWTQTGQTMANGGTVAIGFLDAPGQVEIYCDTTGGSGGTDFILDITGYYG